MQPACENWSSAEIRQIFSLLLVNSHCFYQFCALHFIEFVALFLLNVYSLVIIFRYFVLSIRPSILIFLLSLLLSLSSPLSTFAPIPAFSLQNLLRSSHASADFLKRLRAFFCLERLSLLTLLTLALAEGDDQPLGDLLLAATGKKDRRELTEMVRNRFSSMQPFHAFLKGSASRVEDCFE